MKTCTKCNVSYTDDISICKKCGSPVNDDSASRQNSIKEKSDKNDDSINNQVEIGNPERSWQLSENALSSGKLYEALDYLNCITDINPDDTNIWIKKAILLLLHDNEKISADFRHKLNVIASENLTAKLYLGIEACIANDFENACKLLISVVSKTRKEDEKKIGMFFCAYSLLKVNSEDKKLLMLISHLNLNFHNDNILFFQKEKLEELLAFQGQYFIDKNEYIKAVGNFETAYHISKDDKYILLMAESSYKQSQLEFESGSNDDAKVYIDKAIKHFPKNKEYKTLFRKITANKKRKRIKKALIIAALVLVIIGIPVVIWTALFYMEKNAWISAKSENTRSSMQNYLKAFPQGKHVDEANKLVAEADQLTIDSLAEAVIIYIPANGNKGLSSDSKVDDVLKTFGATEDVLPLNKDSNTFFINKIRASDNIKFSIKCKFTEGVSVPIIVNTGKNWYGEQTYRIEGYKASTEALLSGFVMEIIINRRFEKKSLSILDAICGKIEKRGFKNYSELQQNKSIRCLATDKSIVILKKITDTFIELHHHNINMNNFDDLMQNIKKGIVQ